MIDSLFVVEGEEDKNFLIRFVKFYFDYDLEEKHFIIIEGDISKLHLYKERFGQKPGYDFYFILDCDDHQFDDRKLNIKTTAEQNSITIKELFLLPDNQSNGNLETLLNQIIPDKNRNLIACLNNFIDCANNSGVKGLKSDYRKEIYMMYHGSFENSGLASGARRMYDNPDIWNLNSPALYPLIQFLKNVLK
jgi:hypothetical protein